MPKSKLTIAEQIERAKEDIRQETNKLKLLNQKQKEQERKDRTRRLIERGAIVESLIDGAETLDNERIKTILQTALSSRQVTPRAAATTGGTATTEAE
ncbi:MAG: DUF3847 domain-containing protein [Oscillospiraceae bacterium]|nr:DUF3847 domain-containing protein [Oscillospiraceae bacterium]